MQNQGLRSIKSVLSEAASGDTSSLIDVIANSDVPGLAKLFIQWRDKTQTVPNINTCVDEVVKFFGFGAETEAVVRRAGQLASEPNTNPFHNNQHFLEVFALTAMLGHREQRRDEESLHRLGLVLAAALIHDYKHDGTNNRGEQYRLEKIAMDSAEPFLAEAGASKQDLSIIRAFVLTTDVSKDFSNPDAQSPADRVKIYSATQNPDDLPPELSILHEQGLSDVALMLEDSDLGQGVISVALNVHGGKLVAEELGKPYSPAGQAFFLDKICHRRAFSKAGTELIQPYLNQVLQHFGLSPAIETPHPIV